MAVLYASFSDASLAEKAAGALLDHGARQEDISVVANDQWGQANAAAGTRDHHNTAAGTAGAVAGTAAGAAAGAGRGVSNVADSAVDATKSVGDRVAQAGNRVAAGVAGAVGAHGAAANYDAAADERAARADTRAAMAGNEPAVHGSAAGAAAATDSNVTSTVAGGTTADRDLDPGHTERSAKAGISTTTGADAAKGAAEGAGIGLGIGVLGAAASLFIPGFGLVIGGGALAAAIAAAAGTTAAGAIAGGVTGFLKDQGMPAEVATDYDSAVRNGGAMLSVNVPSNNVDAPTAQSVLDKYGATNVRTY